MKTAGAGCGNAQPPVDTHVLAWVYQPEGSEREKTHLFLKTQNKTNKRSHC